jgi:hypothetical protein
MATVINDSFKKVALQLANLPTGGTIGTASTTVDLYSTFIINQTTVGQVINLPNPTDTSFSDTVDIVNIGTADFQVTGGKIVEKNSNAQAIWTGSVWNYSVGASVSNSNAAVVKARAKVNITDFSTNTIVTQTNLASATIISGSGSSNMVMDFTFTIPLISANYQILGEISANVGEAAGANATIVFETANKTTNGFRVIFRETVSITQNCNFEFVVLENTTVSGVAYTAGAGIDITNNIITNTGTVLSGNIIAIGEKLGTLTQVAFDNLRIRWNSTLDRIEIATGTGTEILEWVTSINYGVQSTLLNGGAGVDSTLQATPITATTTFQIIGDPGLLGIEHRTYNIWSTTTGNHYRVNTIRKGTSTTDGWVTFVVEKIGTTSSQVLTAGSGINITSGVISANTITPVIQSFTASGTYTPTAGMKYCEIELVGGGGGSGGSNAGSVTAIVVSGSGGAGGYAKLLATATEIGASRTITIGAAGTAGTATTGGGNGGNTIITGIATANGGVGGALGTQAGNFPVQAMQGGLGGTAFVTIGTPINVFQGEAGSASYGSLNGGGTALLAGNGGSSPMGAGGRGSTVFFNNLTPNGFDGVPGTGNGSGASGSSSSGTGATTRVGSAGRVGKVIITEYF